MYNTLSDYETLVLKIDVEGMEEKVIKGLSGLQEAGLELYLMIEDFIDNRIISYLNSSGWKWICKRTTYNSWWYYKK